jgi:uncharacterized protein YjbJ (UPF0337 family)
LPQLPAADEPSRDVVRRKELGMGADDDRREGKFDEAKGTVKEKAGDMTGDKDLEREGEKDRAKGNVKQAVGKSKDAASKAKEAAKDALD